MSARKLSLALVLGFAISFASLSAIGGCKSEVPSTGDKSDDGKTEKAAEPTSPAAEQPSEPVVEQPAASSEFDRLLAYMPPEPIAVAYDRLSKRFEPELLAVVFAIPPMAADLLDERQTLDEALDLVFDGDAQPSNWLHPTSFAFTVAITKSPYFLRPLAKPAAELGPLLEQGGFTKNVIDGVELWLPSGSFPWRLAVLDDDVVAFIPSDVPGAGLEPLSKQPLGDGAKSVDAELRRTLGDDPTIELVLVSSGPLVHYDVKQSIAQVQFALRNADAGKAYEGQVILAPSTDPAACISDLRARSHPEENQQIQALLPEVEFALTEGHVVGRLALDPERLKHLLVR